MIDELNIYAVVTAKPGETLEQLTNRVSIFVMNAYLDHIEGDDYMVNGDVLVGENETESHAIGRLYEVGLQEVEVVRLVPFPDPRSAQVTQR